MLFYLRWRNSQFFAGFESLPQMPAKRICGTAAAILSLPALFGADRLITALTSRWKTESPRFPKPIREISFIGVSSVFVITLISVCSPLYSFNDWVDPHTMFTVGKGILKGMMPYRDIFEQKGPVILLLHAVSAALSADSFIGVWLFEILACFFFLLFAWKLLKIRLGDRALSLVPLLGLSVYAAVSFVQGDSAEEFCLPLLSYALYVGYKALYSNELPSSGDWLRIGITAALMFWTKYSMTGFYLGWFLAMTMFALKHKRLPELWSGAGRIIAGVALLSAPILIWFLACGALGDLFHVYFYDNIFLYPKTADLYGNFAVFRNLANGMLNFAMFSTFHFLLLIPGLLWVTRNESRAVSGLYIYSLLGMFLMIYFSGRYYTYYSFIFGVFNTFGFLGLYHFLNKKGWLDRLHDLFLTGLPAAALCLTVIGAFLFSGNMRYLAFEKQDYPQYQAKDLIEADGIENPTLMNYRFLDMGVNMTAGLYPSQRFFCGFNLPLDEIDIEQQRCLDEGCVDYVLSFILKLDHPNYELAGQFEANYSIGKFHPPYNLYRRVNTAASER